MSREWSAYMYIFVNRNSIFFCTVFSVSIVECLFVFFFVSSLVTYYHFCLALYVVMYLQQILIQLKNFLKFICISILPKRRNYSPISTLTLQSQPQQNLFKWEHNLPMAIYKWSQFDFIISSLLKNYILRKFY